MVGDGAGTVEHTPSMQLSGFSHCAVSMHVPPSGTGVAVGVSVTVAVVVAVAVIVAVTVTVTVLVAVPVLVRKVISLLTHVHHAALASLGIPQAAIAERALDVDPALEEGEVLRLQYGRLAGTNGLARVQSLRPGEGSMETKEFQWWTARRKVQLLLQLARGEPYTGESSSASASVAGRQP